MDLPGVRIKTPYEPQQPHKRHKHDWHSMEKHIPGGTMHLNVCTLHVGEDGAMKPVWEAYDMEVTNPEVLRGKMEYETRSQHD